jgi:hypothetical protein
MAMAAFKPPQQGSGIGRLCLRDVSSAAGKPQLMKVSLGAMSRIVIAEDAVMSDEREQRAARIKR